MFQKVVIEINGPTSQDVVLRIDGQEIPNVQGIEVKVIAREANIVRLDVLVTDQFEPRPES